jgi:cell wall-associated NlpC family hydrolase
MMDFLSSLLFVLRQIRRFFFRKVLPILFILCCIIFLFVAAVLESKATQAGAEGSCLAPGMYKSTKGDKPNPTVENTIYSVTKQKTSKLSAADANAIMVAAFDAAEDESTFRNLANDGITHGSEDDGSSPADLAAAAQSLEKNQDGSPKYPYDAIGTDHSSLGVFQQLVGPNQGWGSVSDTMTPSIATANFLKAAMTTLKEHPGASGAEIAYDTQHPAGANPYGGTNEQAAMIELNKVKGGSLAPVAATNAAGVSCTSGGSLVVTCTDTSGKSQCTKTVVNHSHEWAYGDTFIVSLPVGSDGKPNEAGQTIAAGLNYVDAGTEYAYGGGGINGPTTVFYRGANRHGFDCSSFMQYSVYRGTNGRITLPRTSEAQYSYLPSVSKPQPGDLVFYEPASDGPGHVGMYIGMMAKGKDGKWRTVTSNGTDVIMVAPHTGDVLKIQPLHVSPIVGIGHPAYKGLIAAS